MNSRTTNHVRTKRPRRRSGVILLVVLSALTFFSLLVVTYFVFSSQAKQSAFAMNARTTRTPDINGLMEQGMLTLLRGPSDPFNPLWGESLFDDLYGDDGAELTVEPLDPVTPFGRGFVQFSANSSGSRLSDRILEDIYSGRLITFTEGPLENETFRVLRSAPFVTTTLQLDRFYIELKPELIGATFTAAAVQALFADTSVTPATGYSFRLNGLPHDSEGVGLSANGISINQTVHGFATPSLSYRRTPPNTIGAVPWGFDLPVALQPNHIPQIHPISKAGTRGDFNEDYDAPDFNNWFLSHRNEDGTIIPSFHRPAVINYILNTVDWSGGASFEHYRDTMVSLARATMRPIPIAEGQLRAATATTAASAAINERFTGGNGSFALRAPLLMNSPSRMDQLARALIDSFDVDNDSDGRPDSMWIHAGLPLITSPEGKLLRPMLAPMIEDLSGRINLNAVGNKVLNGTSIQANDFGVNATANWANATNPHQANRLHSFRGMGFGPAEIVIPATGTAPSGAVLTEIQNLINTKYGRDNLPGVSGADAADIISSGYRTIDHGLTRQGGYGFPFDPYGRRAVGIGRDGHLTAATDVAANEAVDDPYEFNVTGASGSDTPLRIGQLESLLRAGDYDSEFLPQQIREELRRTLNDYGDLARSLTTTSVSMDPPGATLLEFASAIEAISADFDSITSTSLPPVPQALIDAILAPELRLGRRLDVNRPFGNGISDDGDATIDEPDELAAETNAVGIATTTPAQTLTTAQTADYQSAPDYLLNDNTTQADGSPTPGRLLLARHLYVLMMLVSDRNYPFPGVDAADLPAYRARRIAQWAVNVVDYRDADSVMTRFPYDPSPFDTGGWTPNGTVENTVWGVEEPELLFREGLALHDVRLNDGDDDNGGGDDKMGGDADADQVRVPQGSLFLELQCVHSGRYADQNQRPAYPEKLYVNDTVAGQSVLDLSATTSQNLPIWRIAISEPHVTTKQPVSPLALSQNEPLHGSLAVENRQSREIDAQLPVGDELELDRFILFNRYNNQADVGTVITNVNATGATLDMQADEVFFAPLPTNPNQLLLHPGQFLVVAPRNETRIGSRNSAGDILPSAQRFVRNAAGNLVHWDSDITSTLPRTPSLGNAATDHYTNALTVLVGAERPAGWQANMFPDGYVGLNISEPLRTSYYPMPPTPRRFNGTSDLDTDGNIDYPLFDAYLDMADAATSPSRDEPVDPQVTPAILPSTGTEPDLGTLHNFRTAYLQRLADPTLPFNEVTNPYRTVDWMSLDLTVFSGEDRASAVSASVNAFDQRSLQRTGNGQNILYSNETSAALPGTVNGAAQDYFAFTNGYIQNSLGFLNTAEANINPGFAGYAMSIGNRVATFNNPAPPATPPATPVAQPFFHDRNLPVTPYAVHSWLNRPFTTHLELMMVPACSQTRLLEEFGIPTGDPNIYPNDGTDAVTFRGPFPHLLNFFHSHRTDALSAQFGRIFEFVHTLPRFKGEVELIAPDRLTATGSEFLAELFEAPFNFKYDNRRNGKINLNTLNAFPAWAGLMQGHMNAGEFQLPAGTSQLAYEQFLNDRRGYTTGNPVQRITSGSQYSYRYQAGLNPVLPTQFAGVFRSSFDTPFSPVVHGSTPNLLRRRPVNGTLLRGNGTLATADPPGAPNPVSMFVRAVGEQPATLHQNRQRNPFVRYQTLMRMPNLVSENSQTYLMRLTLGLFEVDPANTDNVGREYKAESGENQRYRATFIIDRSKPVGFQRGQDLNIRDAIIFESYDQ